MRLTPKNELEYRCRKLQSVMAGAGLDAVLVLQKADLFYFTGTIQSGILYVPASGEPLYLVQRDFMRARMESALREVVPCAGLDELPRFVSDYGYPEPAHIGLELDVLPVNLFEKLRCYYPAAVCRDASPLIRRIRMVKSHYEIHILQDASQQADKLHRLAGETIRAGISEVEVAAELERLARREGHQGVVRLRSFNGELHFGRVLSGTDAATPSSHSFGFGGMGLTPAFGQGASYRRIDRGEPVLVESACCYDGYLVSQARVFSVGEPSAPMRRAYDAMLEVQLAVTDLAGRGARWGDLYRAGVQKAADLGYAESFLGPQQARSPWLGHGVGIEFDEDPVLCPEYREEVWEPGVVFTLEPKVIFPGEGAVGIDNTFYVSELGLKQLTFSDENMLIIQG